MNKAMNLIFILLLLVAGFMAYVRLAPSDPAVWNPSLPTDLARDGRLQIAEGSARVAMPATADSLARLNEIALATPRTKLIAGSVAEGRMTWQTRSAVFGFPDYITAQITDTSDGPRLDIYARLRFGKGDMGVNAARLRNWLAGL